MPWWEPVRFLALTAIVVASFGFVPANASPAGAREPVVATGRALRATRVLETAPAPAGWRAVRDRDTGVVVRLWGSYVDVAGAVRDPAIAERAARAFFAAHLELFAPGARLADFVLVANRLDGGVRSVAFGQVWNGLRVVGGQVHVVFANDRLFLAGSEALPRVELAIDSADSAVRRGNPATGRADAWVRAETGLAVIARATGERVVLPLVHGKGDIEYRVADVVDVSAPTGRWDVYVAPDGSPLLRVNRLSYATGTLRFDVGARRPGGPRVLAPAARVNLTVDGAQAITDDAGTFAWPGTAAAAITSSVTGDLVQIVNAAGALATAQLVAQPGQPVDWSLADDEFGDAQLTAYVYAMVAKARARVMEPSLAWLDLPLQIHVNEADSCNAFSTGDDLHFFRKNAVCENTGRLSDVVMHEFGHSFHKQSIITGVGAFNQAMSEGAADFFAANIDDDSGVGRGFNFDDTAVRDMDPPGTEKRFPGDVNGSPHLTGLIFAGAMWDLRKALIAELGPARGIAVTEQMYVGILQRATDIPTTYLAALTADDDDGNLGNGTPHSCAIEAAFGRHGIASPGFETTTIGAPNVAGTTVSFTVTTPAAVTCPRPRVTAMSLAWQLGTGTPTTIAMTAQGDTWSATIPAQPDNTIILYRAIATFDDGSTANLPDNAADPLYQLLVGAATPIWCEPLDVDPQWTQVGQAEWHVAPPRFVEDPPAAFTGTNVLGTNGDVGGAYNAFNFTSIETPAIDTSAYEHVHLQFRRWLAVEDGMFDQATIAIDGATVWQNAASTPGTLDHVDREWRLVDLELTPSPATKIAWTLDPDGSRQLGGWNLDDICVVGLGKIPRCGDAFVDVNETCDDGNATLGDGCTPDCVSEPSDEGGCCSSSTNPSGWIVLGLLVWGQAPLAQLMRRKSLKRRRSPRC